MEGSVFHEGERAVQARLGVREVETWARKVVRPYMPEQHRAFYEALPFLVVAARDANGLPWVTLLDGPTGFVQAPDARTLHIDARPPVGDALEHAFATPTDLGMIGIEFGTRRRNRVNGRAQATRTGLHFEVGQSFGNCPQYIHPRQWSRVRPTPAPARRSTALDPDQRTWIEAADTLFIGSGHRGEGPDPAFGMDASHRGGDPGFVHIEGPSRLVIPDYAGNNHFNTLGNLVLDPRVGLVFVDFARGSLLQLSGRATIDWDSPAVSRLPGAQRRIVVDIDAVVELPGALGLRWHDSATMQRMVVVSKTAESADVTSFELAPAEGSVATFEPGQHLPVALELPDHRDPVHRSYSLSRGPGGSTYRISVKREPHGLVSRALHDTTAVGDSLLAGAPSGAFVLQGNRTAVLLSAGVGVTPMLAMLHGLTAHPERPVVFVHAARNGAHHPFRAEVEALARTRGNTVLAVRYSDPLPDDPPDDAGRLDAATVHALADDPEADYFVCGPPGFMAAMFEGLEALGVPPHRVHTETFGPSAAPR